MTDEITRINRERRRLLKDLLDKKYAQKIVARKNVYKRKPKHKEKEELQDD